MKKIYTLLLAIMLISTATMAQKGLSLGLNGEFTGITIINQNSWGNGHEYDYKFTTGSAFGLDVGYNFTDELGLYSGFGMMTLGQDYTDKYSEIPDGTESDWERTIRLKYNVIPVMLKFTGSETTVNFIGGFGILVAMLKQADQTWTKDGNDWTGDIEDGNSNLGAKDVTNRYESTDIIINLELGARIFFIDNLYMDATINLGYGVKDINAEGWRIPDTGGAYSASHNAYGGIKIGIAYVLFGE